MSEKIILVDDDSNILTSVSLALRSEGWSVETYNDGEQRSEEHTSELQSR